MKVGRPWGCSCGFPTPDGTAEIDLSFPLYNPPGMTEPTDDALPCSWRMSAIGHGTLANNRYLMDCMTSPYLVVLRFK